MTRSDDIPFSPVHPPNRWDGRNQCGICIENIVNCVFRCGHPICFNCALVLMRRGSGCPVCRMPSDICFAMRLSASISVSQNTDETAGPIRLDAFQICNTNTTVRNVFVICGHVACSVCAIGLIQHGAACPFCNDKIKYLLKVYW